MQTIHIPNAEINFKEPDPRTLAWGADVRAIQQSYDETFTMKFTDDFNPCVLEALFGPVGTLSEQPRAAVTIAYGTPKKPTLTDLYWDLLTAQINYDYALAIETGDDWLKDFQLTI